MKRLSEIMCAAFGCKVRPFLFIEVSGIKYSEHHCIRCGKRFGIAPTLSQEYETAYRDFEEILTRRLPSE